MLGPYTIQFGVKRSVLAIGAHPDDIELGCGGTIAKLCALGVHVRALVFTQGQKGKLGPGDRAVETRCALSLLGVADVVICDFDDTRLWLQMNEMVAVIEQHVRDLTPFRVYTMFEEDRHQDHRAVYEASAIACRRVPEFLSYETPSSYPNFRPTMFEAIDELLDLKVEALRQHHSQGERLYMQADKVRSAANFRGAQVDRGPCEGFMPCRLVH